MDAYFKSTEVEKTLRTCRGEWVLFNGVNDDSITTAKLCDDLQPRASLKSEPKISLPSGVEPTEEGDKDPPKLSVDGTVEPLIKVVSPGDREVDQSAHGASFKAKVELLQLKMSPSTLPHGVQVFNMAAKSYRGIHKKPKDSCPKRFLRFMNPRRVCLCG